LRLKELRRFPKRVDPSKSLRWPGPRHLSSSAKVGKGGSARVSLSLSPPPRTGTPESVAHCVDTARAKREVATDICFASRVICGSNIIFGNSMSFIVATAVKSFFKKVQHERLNVKRQSK